MQNRGFTRAEMLQHTILTNRAAKQPTAATCPTCGGTTRTINRAGYLWRVCGSRSCTWEGVYLEAETAAALESMPAAERVRVMELRSSSMAMRGAEMGIGGVA